MEFPVAPPYRTAILRQYEQNIARYPVIRGEVEDYLNEKDEPFSLCLRYLYGHMSAQDVMSTAVSVFGAYVRATLAAYEQLEYVQSLPAEIFFPYVLYHRINSECLDNSREFLMNELLPHVRGKSMEQAALAVNYWCYAHATYTPADDRTLGPLAVLRRTLGRCGEESVLAAAALRSVGIPARQVYCPRWSHCDDNHAWVEVWIDGQWHYMGACEPEPVLDRGWFTAAASRAMLIDTRQWSGDSLYEPVNCVSRYTHERILTVKVTDQGIPVPDARVCIQVVNYSELYTLWEASTDEYGLARFETGAGDLLVFAQHAHKVALKKADLRVEDFLTLELESDFPAQLTADLVPPEDRSGTVPYADEPRHRQNLTRCEAHSAARRAVFEQNQGYLRHAAGNAAHIQAFLDDPRYPMSHKEALLNTLRPKDFVDITHETLAEALDIAAPVRGLYPAEIFQAYILAPRVADEPLLPERRKIRALFPHGFADPGEILKWLRDSMEILPDNGIVSYYPSAYGCLRCRQVPAFAFDAVFVALCRAFGFPACLDIHTGKARWLDSEGIWHSIHSTDPPVSLTLELPAGRRLRYFEHITLGCWDGHDFVTLKYPELTLENRHTFFLAPGLYRVTVTARQIDGTASVALWHLDLTRDHTLRITPPEDQTALRLKQVPLELPEGPLRRLMNRDGSRNLLLIFADPGSEPTEHLLREMQEIARNFRSLPCRILLLTEKEEALAHPTVRLLKKDLPEVELAALQDPEALAALYRQMQVGDLRLPFVVCTDRRGHGIYATANYGIRMAQTLLEIQKICAN